MKNIVLVFLFLLSPFLTTLYGDENEQEIEYRKKNISISIERIKVAKEKVQKSLEKVRKAKKWEASNWNEVSNDMNNYNSIANSEISSIRFNLSTLLSLDPPYKNITIPNDVPYFDDLLSELRTVNQELRKDYDEVQVIRKDMEEEISDSMLEMKEVTNKKADELARDAAGLYGTKTGIATSKNMDGVVENIATAILDKFKKGIGAIYTSIKVTVGLYYYALEIKAEVYVIKNFREAIKWLDNLESTLTGDISYSDQAIQALTTWQYQVKFIQNEIKAINDEIRDTQEIKGDKKLKKMKNEIDEFKVKIVNQQAQTKYQKATECKEAFYLANGSIKALIDTRKTVANLSEQYGKVTKNYYDSIVAKTKEIKTTNSKRKNNYKNSAYITESGIHYDRTIPFNSIINDTIGSNKQEISNTEAYYNDLKYYNSSLVSNMPGKPELNALNKAIANYNNLRATYYNNYNYYNTKCSSLHKKLGTIPKVKIYFYSQSDKLAYLNDVKYLVKQGINKADSVRVYLDFLKNSYDYKISRITSYFKLEKKRIEDALNNFIQKEREAISFNNKINQTYQTLLNNYKTKRYKLDNKGTGGLNKYNVNTKWLLIGVTEESSTCEIVKKIERKVLTRNFFEDISLRNKIKHNRLKGTGGAYIPSYAHVNFPELASNAKSLQIEANKTREKRSKFDMEYLNTGSNATYIYNNVSDKNYAALSLFYDGIYKKIYENKTKDIKIFSNVMSNMLVEIKALTSSKRVHKDTYKNKKEFFNNRYKLFIEKLSCFDDKSVNKIEQQLFEYKNYLNKLKGKETYKDVSSLFKKINKLKEEISTLEILGTKTYETKVKALYNDYQTFDKQVDNDRDLIWSLDYENLNKLLNEIQVLFTSHLEFLKDKEKIQNDDLKEELIKTLYNDFSKYYSDANLGSLMNLISQNWESDSDGVSVMDLEETLDNSFSIFDEINCTIENLEIRKIGLNKYQTSYIISISGFIYDNDIVHNEKSSVREEVTINNGKAVISKTLSGSFWPSK